MVDEFTLRQYPLPLPKPFDLNKPLCDFDTPKPGVHHDQGWPVVYVLTNDKAHTAYIGETTNYQRRMKQHTDNPAKDFNRSLLIDYPLFNQSATFDFENRLIELFCADENYTVTNANNGCSQIDYYERPLYRQSFRKLWQTLREMHYAVHPLEELENSDLFKFSPYKTLTPDQYEAIESIFSQIERDKDRKNVRRVTIVNGYPGTGKTILAVSLLFKIKNEPKTKDIKIGFVTPMVSLKRTLRKLAALLPGLKPGDIISPSELRKKERYDILLVDEAHRLGNYLSAGAGVKSFYDSCDALQLPHSSNQVDWVFKCCDKAFLFYDPKQQIRASGLSSQELENRLLRLESEGIETDEFTLTTQMRVRGGDEYLDFVYNLLNNKAYMHDGMNFDALFSDIPFDARSNDPGRDCPRYQFAIIDRFADFCALQKQKEAESGLSRMVAGFAWKWQSKTDKNAFDITIEGIRKRWNSTQKDWVNSEGATDEVGCVHTVQGYDLNYGFVILGPDIRYDKNNDEVCVSRQDFKDTVAKKKATEQELQSIILNAYYVLMTRGMLGTFIYVCDPALKEYLSRYIPLLK